MNSQLSRLLAITLFIIMIPISYAAMKDDNKHTRTWNAFADNILKLHQILIEGKDVKVKTRIGGYSGTPDFYREEKFINKKTEKVISIVQWEKENPKKMHTIEVFVYDKKGRVSRDYAAAYLPTYRNAPTQTLVSLHQYNGKLHAFRTFDATGDRIVDRCEGTLKGQEVNLLLDEDEIYEAQSGSSNAMEHPSYKACFKGLPNEPGKYLTPQ